MLPSAVTSASLASALFHLILGVLSSSLETNSSQLPYGPNLEASLPGIAFNEPEEGANNATESGEDSNSALSWWHSIDRNNRINCTCGLYGKSNLTERWEDEGISMLNAYSWSVSLVSPGQSFAYCGGSLVNDRYVLTAASCVDGSVASGVEVLIGTWPYSHMNHSELDELNTLTALRRKVRRVILHPQYASEGIDHNIALLRLTAPVTRFGEPDGFNPVCLPKTEESFDGQRASSLVWRFAQDDQTIIPIKRTEIESVLISKEECKAYKYSDPWANMPDSLMCSMAESPGGSHPFADTFSCPGDAGGPLVVDKTTASAGQKIQVGVDSWTPCYGRPERVGVFTRVSEFIPWINKHIAEDGRHCLY